MFKNGAAPRIQFWEAAGVGLSGVHSTHDDNTNDDSGRFAEVRGVKTERLQPQNLTFWFWSWTKLARNLTGVMVWIHPFNFSIFARRAKASPCVCWCEMVKTACDDRTVVLLLKAPQQNDALALSCQRVHRSPSRTFLVDKRTRLLLCLPPQIVSSEPVSLVHCHCVLTILKFQMWTKAKILSKLQFFILDLFVKILSLRITLHKKFIVRIFSLSKIKNIRLLVTSARSLSQRCARNLTFLNILKLHKA